MVQRESSNSVRAGTQDPLDAAPGAIERSMENAGEIEKEGREKRRKGRL